MALPDVQAIARLSESRSGAGGLALLDCLGRFGSIREIAAAQHMHHSSVAYRLAKISEILGYDPRPPQGQYRARTALLLWHLHTHLPARRAGDAELTGTTVACIDLLQISYLCAVYEQ